MSIILADDHPITLFGTKQYLESLDYNISSFCTNGITAFNEIYTKKFDIALLDINMPGMNGLEILEKIYNYKIRTKVILLTMHREITIYKRACELNAYGYILKNHSLEELDICLKSVTQNVRYFSPDITDKLFINESDNINKAYATLTRAESKILEMIGNQYNTNQIAKLLFISEKTVEGHRRSIIEKLGLPKEKNVLLNWALKNLQSK